MDDLRPGSLEVPRPLTIEQMQAQTSQFARYELYPNPDVLLRRGLLEETFVEYLEHIDAAAKAGIPPNVDELEGEIGDILWYVSEIARFKGVDLSEGTALTAIDGYQSNAVQLIQNVWPIYSDKNEAIDAKSTPHQALAVAVLRVIDVMNPKPESAQICWVGIPDGQRPDLQKALQDLLICLSLAAKLDGVALSAAITHTIQKLEGRPRPTHVIKEAVVQSAEQLVMTSGRKRALPMFVRMGVKYWYIAPEITGKVPSAMKIADK